MLAFLDTEFTDLVTRPRLLSVGIATDLASGPQFYAEVTDPDRLRATNRFGQANVLPQFGAVAHAACSYAELGGRLSTFLDGLVAKLQADAFVELAFGYHLDWDLVDLAIRDAGSTSWASTRRRIQPVNIYPLTGFGAGQLAAEAYFKAQADAPFSRHHALCDARALCLAFAAATRAATGPFLSSMPPEGQRRQPATAEVAVELAVQAAAQPSSRVAVP